MQRGRKANQERVQGQGHGLQLLRVTILQDVQEMFTSEWVMRAEGRVR